MTATDYFHYCKIAYIAGKRQDESVDESLSGREMYARYADGRHEGLLDIDPDSAQEFADWIDSKHLLKKSAGILGRSNAAAIPPTSTYRLHVHRTSAKVSRLNCAANPSAAWWKQCACC